MKILYSILLSEVDFECGVCIQYYFFLTNSRFFYMLNLKIDVSYMAINLHFYIQRAKLYTIFSQQYEKSFMIK